MQFQVPQFSEAEDHIVGPLSLRQFLYLAIPAVMILLLYFAVATWVWFIISIILGPLGASFAFLKINGRPFTKIFLAIAGYYWNPQTYAWQPENPAVQKTEQNMRTFWGGEFSLENLISGASLRTAWHKVQLEPKRTPVRGKKSSDKFEIFRGLQGDRRAAKRVDYR